MKITNRSYISTYKPLTNPDDDLLEFKPFAKHVANSIQNLPVEEGYIIGLYGEWGSGKTTVLNFIEIFLLKENEKKQKNKNITLHFNPWMFSDAEELVTIFFDQLISVLRGNFNKFARESYDRLISVIGGLSDIVSEAPVPGSKLPKKIVHYFPELNTKDIHKIKNKINELLEESGDRIIIIVDDIDRLAKDEIIQIFRLIKSVADFSNIVYLVAFDKNIVAQALDDDFHNGENFLEKIVQIPINIPIVHQRFIDDYILDSISKLTANLSDKSLFNESEWERIYKRYIFSYFKNFRDVTRFVTLVNFEFGAVAGEVNVIDFLILNVLRLHESKIYELIRGNPQYFISDPNYPLSDPLKKLFPDFHRRSWLANLEGEEKKEKVIRLLLALFPRLQELQEIPQGYFYGATSQQCRISNPDYFPIYFRYELFKDQLTHKVYTEIISLTSNSTTLIEQLFSILGDGRIFDFFDKVRNDENLSVAKRIMVIEAIFGIGDDILVHSKIRNYSIALNNIIIDFLFSIDTTEERFSHLFNILKSTKTVSLSLLFLIELHHRLENPYRFEKQLFSDEQFSQLMGYFDQTMQNLILTNKIFDIYDNLYILVKWNEWNSEKVSILLDDDTRFIKFLCLFESGWRIGFDNWNYFFDFKTLKHFVDPEILIARVRELDAQDQWSESESTALKQFIRDFDAGLHNRP